MREATEIEKLIGQLKGLSDRLGMARPPLRDFRTTQRNSCITKAQERVIEARMWLEEAEKLDD